MPHLNLLRDASIRVILENQSSSGAYIASPSFRVYNYSWIRDGAFIADAMLDHKQIESASLFHNWVSSVVLSRRNKIDTLILRNRSGENIAPDEHLHCRYTVEGEESDEPWTNFQLDGFGTWIWALDRFQSHGNSLTTENIQATELLISYLAEFWSADSFDWWEESFGYQHVATLGSVSAGLKACSAWSSISQKNRSLASTVARKIRLHISENLSADFRLTKWIGGTGLDGSLASLIAPFGLYPPNSLIARQTILAIEQELGLLGTYRHLDDVYFGGGKWLILSSFLALAILELGDNEKPRAILEWLASTADENLQLPEQLPAPLLHPGQRQEWIDKWGEPAQPLLWSHAMYLKLYSSISQREEN